MQKRPVKVSGKRDVECPHLGALPNDYAEYIGLLYKSFCYTYMQKRPIKETYNFAKETHKNDK